MRAVFRRSMATLTASDLASAALRHVRDAEHLLTAGDHQSVDQAYHLAGFGPECIRKAALSARWGDKVIGHDFSEDLEAQLDVLIALDPLSVRAGAEGFARRFPEIATWDVSGRYERTGTIDEAEARKLVEAARRAVDETLLTLWLDGRLDDGALA